MGFSMSLSVRQEQRMEQKLSMSQQLRQALILDPIEPNPFREPEGHSGLKHGPRGPYFEVGSDDLQAFAASIKVASGIILRSAPDVVLVGMRGANPYAEAIKYSLHEDPNHSRFFRGMTGNTSKTEGSRRLPEFIDLPSTYFRKDLAKCLQSALVKATPSAIKNHGSDGTALRFMLIDTSVTGTKLGWYLPEFVDACQKASTISKKEISLDVVVFKPSGRSGHIETDGLTGVPTRVHEIVIPNLITEDVPALLTPRDSKLRIKSQDVRSEAFDMIHSLDPFPKAGIEVTGEYGSFFPYKDSRDTFACFQMAFREAYETVTRAGTMPQSVTVFPGLLSARDKCESELLIPLREINVVRDSLAEMPAVNFPPRGDTDQKSLQEMLRTLTEQTAEQIARFSWGCRELYPSVPELKASLVRLKTDLENYLAWDVGYQSIANLMKSINPQNRFEEAVAKALYQSLYAGLGVEAATRRGIALEHQPHNALAAMATLLSPDVRNHYNIALIVGPEGFAYEPILDSIGMPAIAVNIPEADPNGARTIQKFKGEALSRLSKRKVLIIEDDVRSGATLRALLEILPTNVKEFGLFLGSSPAYQTLSNIPDAITRVHGTPDSMEGNYGMIFDFFNKHHGLDLIKIDPKRSAASSGLPPRPNLS